MVFSIFTKKNILNWIKCVNECILFIYILLIEKKLLSKSVNIKGCAFAALWSVWTGSSTWTFWFYLYIYGIFLKRPAAVQNPRAANAAFSAIPQFKLALTLNLPILFDLEMFTLFKNSAVDINYCLHLILTSLTLSCVKAQSHREARRNWRKWCHRSGQFSDQSSQGWSAALQALVCFGAFSLLLRSWWIMNPSIVLK